MSVRFEFFKLVLRRGDGVVNYRKAHTIDALSVFLRLLKFLTSFQKNQNSDINNLTAAALRIYSKSALLL